MKEIDKQNFTNYMEVKSFGDIFPKKRHKYQNTL